VAVSSLVAFYPMSDQDRPDRSKIDWLAARPPANQKHLAVTRLYRTYSDFETKIQLGKRPIAKPKPAETGNDH
jgi:hypothetical protein